MVDLLFSNEQLYLIIMIILWLVTLFMSEDKEDIALYWIQFIICIPLGLFLLSEAYLKSLPYGYLIGFSIFLISSYYTYRGLITYAERKENNK